MLHLTIVREVYAAPTRSRVVEGCSCRGEGVNRQAGRVEENSWQLPNSIQTSDPVAKWPWVWLVRGSAKESLRPVDNTGYKRHSQTALGVTWRLPLNVFVTFLLLSLLSLYELLTTDLNTSHMNPYYVTLWNFEGTCETANTDSKEESFKLIETALK